MWPSRTAHLQQHWGCSKHQVYTHIQTVQWWQVVQRLIWSEGRMTALLMSERNQWKCNNRPFHMLRAAHKTPKVLFLFHMFFWPGFPGKKKKHHKSSAIVLSVTASPNNFWTCWLISGLTDRDRSQRDYILTRCVKIIETPARAFPSSPHAAPTSGYQLDHKPEQLWG